MMQSSKIIASLFYKASSNLLKAWCNQIIAPILQNKFKLVQVKPIYCIITIFKQASTCFKDDAIMPKKAMIGIKIVPFYSMFDFIAKI